MLSGSAQAAPAGAKGFDANAVVDAAQAQAFLAAGFQFALRYVGRTEMASHDLTTAEAETLLSAGLALMPVQHVLGGEWMPTGALGAEYGVNAAAFSQQIGFPPGVNVWLDLESVSTQAAASDVVAYCTSWYTAVSAAGYVPGVYIGWQPGLSGTQLYDLPFQHYWAAYNVDGVSTPHPRGYQLVQSSGSGTIGGFGTDVYDVDETYVDNEQGQVLWLKS
jgi:hypothetical protein